jgi:hypothetical protein
MKRLRGHPLKGTFQEEEIEKDAWGQACHILILFPNLERFKSVLAVSYPLASFFRQSFKCIGSGLRYFSFVSKCGTT